MSIVLTMETIRQMEYIEFQWLFILGNE